jgi:hypothetical protein
MNYSMTAFRHHRLVIPLTHDVHYQGSPTRERVRAKAFTSAIVVPARMCRPHAFRQCTSGCGKFAAPNRENRFGAFRVLLD